MVEKSVSVRSPRPSARNSVRQRVRRPSAAAYPPRSRKFTAPSSGIRRSGAGAGRRRLGRRHETGMSHMGNQRDRSCSTGRSAPTIVRMRSSSSVSRRSLEASTGAKG